MLAVVPGREGLMFSGTSVRMAVPAVAVVVAAGLAAPIQAHSSVASPAGLTASGQRTAAIGTATFEQRLLTLTNQRRVNIGCPPLRRILALVAAARHHSAGMARRKLLSHRLPGEWTLGTRITRAGYRGWIALAENIAVSRPDPAATFRLWIGSPTHRRNIDNCRYRDIGIGVAYGGGRAWSTQDFGRR